MSSMHEQPVEPATPGPPVRSHLRALPTPPLDFDGAVRRVGPQLQRYASRRLADPHEAEELAQEALLRAYTHRDELSTEADLSAWCTVVTGRLVIDRLRVRARSVNVAEVPEGARVGRDTAEVVLARDEARIALNALDAMPPRQAAVLWAREVEGLTYDQIGLQFQMTEPAVRSILTRARKALRKEYADRGGGLPLAGLGALAPWANGLGLLERLRRATGRLAAPTAIGLVGLGLLGGVLGSPLDRGTHTAPTDATALVRAPLVTRSATLRAPAQDRAPLPHHVLPVSSGRAGRPAGQPTIVDRTALPVTCLATSGAGVGGGRCAGRRAGGRLYADPSLPDNPTGIHDVGVQSDKIDCTRMPETAVTTCQPAPTGGTR